MSAVSLHRIDAARNMWRLGSVLIWAITVVADLCEELGVSTQTLHAGKLRAEAEECAMTHRTRRPYVVAIIAFGLSACNMSSPLEVSKSEISQRSGISQNETFDSRGIPTTHLTQNYANVQQITITSKSDNNITITKITVNRGNCFTDIKLPLILNFGEKWTAFASCDPVEVTIDTDQGSYTYNF